MSLFLGHSFVVPVTKSHNHPSLSNNYRPIALTSILSFEKVHLIYRYIVEDLPQLMVNFAFKLGL